MLNELAFESAVIQARIIQNKLASCQHWTIRG